jgi:hypothetical protein
MTLTGKTRLTDSSQAFSRSTTQTQAKKLRHKLLGGSLTLLAGSGLVGVTNLVYNVVTARLLGPTGFAHATAVYTLLMLASAITLSFQVACAKYVASHETADEKAAIFAALHLRAWVAGIAFGIVAVCLQSRTHGIPESSRSGIDFAAGAGNRFLHSSWSAPRVHPGSPRIWRARH